MSSASAIFVCPPPTDLWVYRATILRVVDGDTIDAEVDLGFGVYRRDRFRLQGIDTPELNSRDPDERQRALHARNRLIELAGAGTRVLLRTHRDRQEKYGRYLTEVWTEAGQDVVATLLQEGHGHTYSGGAR